MTCSSSSTVSELWHAMNIAYYLFTFVRLRGLLFALSAASSPLHVPLGIFATLFLSALAADSVDLSWWHSNAQQGVFDIWRVLSISRMLSISSCCIEVMECNHCSYRHDEAIILGYSLLHLRGDSINLPVRKIKHRDVMMWWFDGTFLTHRIPHSLRLASTTEFLRTCAILRFRYF